MNLELLYWHWIVFGIALMLVEIVLPSFTILWFGAGAVTVGLVLLVLPGMSITAQIILWSALSLAFTVIWFRFIKPLSVDKTKAGLSRESIIGEIGLVQQIPNEDRRGRLRFPAPILGSDEWQFICEDTLDVGDRVTVFDLSGNTLMVRKNQVTIP